MLTIHNPSTFTGKDYDNVRRYISENETLKGKKKIKIISDVSKVVFEDGDVSE